MGRREEGTFFGFLEAFPVEESIFFRSWICQYLLGLPPTGDQSSSGLTSSGKPSWACQRFLWLCKLLGLTWTPVNLTCVRVSCAWVAAPVCFKLLPSPHHLLGAIQTARSTGVSWARPWPPGRPWSWTRVPCLLTRSLARSELCFTSSNSLGRGCLWC